MSKSSSINDQFNFAPMSAKVSPGVERRDETVVSFSAACVGTTECGAFMHTMNCPTKFHVKTTEGECKRRCSDHGVFMSCLKNHKIILIHIWWDFV